MSLLTKYFSIKRGEQQLRELQVKAEEMYYHQAVAENELLEHEPPEVREWLKSEFDFQYAMNRIADNYADRGIHFNYQPPKTEDTIIFARAMSKLPQRLAKTKKPHRTSKNAMGREE